MNGEKIKDNLLGPWRLKLLLFEEIFQESDINFHLYVVQGRFEFQRSDFNLIRSQPKLWNFRENEIYKLEPLWFDRKGRLLAKVPFIYYVSTFMAQNLISKFATFCQPNQFLNFFKENLFVF